MFAHLQHIYDRRERWMVGVADIGLRAIAWPAALFGARAVSKPKRILVFRLERIGDLLMTLGALESMRATWPDARVDLVIGSWNADLASCLPWVDRVDTFDVPWLARPSDGATQTSLMDRIRRWRAERYDLAFNLEGDIRSNVMLALSGARTRVGFPMAGGGPVLTLAVPHDPRRHTDENARRLVREAAGLLGTTLVEPEPTWPRLALPESARVAAGQLLAGVRHDVPLVGLHASGGRSIKQWPPERFAEAAAAVARAIGGTIVLTGSTADRPLVDEARAALPADVPVVDVSGPAPLTAVAALLERLRVYITGDTGPMHLAASMGTPTVAVFGLSDPARYAPLAPHTRVVRVDLPCSPCNRVRLPPERCRGIVPDCLTGVTVDAVHHAALDLLREVDAVRGRRFGTPA